MKILILLLILSCADASAADAWTPAQAKIEARRIVEMIVEAQSLLKHAIRTKDKAGWEGFVARELEPLRQSFYTQRWSQNKALIPYEDCESALMEYKLYSETFFRPDDMDNLQSRDVNRQDFLVDFAQCKRAVGWAGSSDLASPKIPQSIVRHAELR